MLAALAARAVIGVTQRASWMGKHLILVHLTSDRSSSCLLAVFSANVNANVVALIYNFCACVATERTLHFAMTICWV